MHEALRDLQAWDIRILATDLDTEVLAKGQRAVYAAERVNHLGSDLRQKYFDEHGAGRSRTYAVAEPLRRLVAFRELNLIHELPLRGPLDAIFCRNVVIYFDKETQRELFARMARLQPPGTHLFLGHSESLFCVSDAYELVGKTIYRRR